VTTSFANGRYVVERVLGRGGMATVYLARDVELDRLVAVKALNGLLADSVRAGDRFRREALTVARLSHPNVVGVYDAGADGNEPFIVMEYVEGDGLDSVLERDAPLEPGRVIELALQACDGLGYAHERGIVHRDVKPANLLLRSDGALKVSDFGIALSADRATKLTQVGAVMGTLEYLAPEQAGAETVGPQADVFSLGVVLYEALTGALPWRAENVLQVATRGDVPPARMRGTVPPRLEAAIMRSLEREPANRPADARALARELTNGPEAPTVRLDAPTRVLQKRRRAPRGSFALLLALGALAAIVAIALLVASLEDGSAQPPAPVTVAPVPAADDPAEQARNLEEWIRGHTRPQGG
jgi:serine/threonine-protein kinase